MERTARYRSLAPLLDWRQAVRPIPWARTFGRRAPLVVEIGFGNGEYLVRQALQYPDRDFVGIEPEWASIQRCLRKLALADIHNVRLMQVNAQVAFERLFCQSSVEQVSALFPCPWPKERHIKHRLFAKPFLELINSRLTCRGTLYIVTDRLDYSAWVERQAEGTGFVFQGRRIAAQFSTKYERKWQAQGQEHFYELCLQKQRAISRSTRKDRELQTHRVQGFDPEQFKPVDLNGEITIKFKDFIYDPRQRRAMQWIFVVEDHLGQDIWIDIAKADDGWRIRPSRGSTFIPTRGLQQALDIIRDTIVGG